MVVHDFDKAGFEIAQRLTTVSDWAEENDRVTYEFKNEIEVYDLGLRLDDVRKYNLEGLAESCNFSGHFARDTITTEEERQFLKSGRRVELNAMTSPQFVEWLVAKLSLYLPHKLIPDNDVLTDAYRRALAVAEINREIGEVAADAIDRASSAQVPKDLRNDLEKLMKEHGDSLPWDEALYQLASGRIDDDEEDNDEEDAE